MPTKELSNMYRIKTLFKQLKKELRLIPETEPLDFEIPRDPQIFYENFGFLSHPRIRDKNNQPVPVTKLAPYQIAFWKYPGNALAIKSQKIGLTTSSLMEDFQFTMLPEGAGKDVLVIAQNQMLANDHIRTLKYMIYRSRKYSQFLLTRPEEVFREEKSKVSVIYVRNPYDRKRPSRIIGLGKSESSVWSWKNVGKIHMSDVAKLDMKEQQTFFAAVYSRLANTNGVIKIETPPNGQQGEVYHIYNNSKTRIAVDESISQTFVEDPDNNSSKFKVFEFPAREAVSARIISEEFLDQERRELGDLLFSQLYECNFLPPGNQWYNESMIAFDDYEVLD